MAIHTSNELDENNETTTPLAGDAVYTGTSVEVFRYATITVNIYSDVSSATDGVEFQFSSDGTNWDDIRTFTLDVSNSNILNLSFPVVSRYFRIVYTNGSGAQSEFRLQTILHSNDLTPVGSDGNTKVTVSGIDVDLDVDNLPENSEVTLLASAARTATNNSADQDNTSWRGCHVIIDVTVDGGGNFTPKIQGKDSITGNYYDLLEGKNITSTGTTIIKIYPGISAKKKVSASDILVKTWRVEMVHNNASSMTYSVSASLVI